MSQTAITEMLFDPAEVRDACGVGFVANIKNQASHEILDLGFGALSNLVHRGAIDADGKTGDGAGVLTAIPHDYYRRRAAEAGTVLPNDAFAVAMIFFPPDAAERKQCQKITADILAKYAIPVLWTRAVPINTAVLGRKASATMPVIRQKFLGMPRLMGQGATRVKNSATSRPEVGEVSEHSEREGEAPAAMPVEGATRAPDRAREPAKRVGEEVPGDEVKGYNNKQDQFEQLLYLVRKEIEAIAIDRSFKDFYIASMSSRTIIHKGLFVGDQVREFYLDLKETDFATSFCLFHQRFSTNTFPTWPLSQPFRLMAHNGEINTIRGNRNWMYAREMAEQPLSWVPEHYALKNIIVAGHSDSASFDNALEAYVHAGRSVTHGIVHMMPEAWQNQNDFDHKLRAFYEFHACIGEAWDGPAAVSFTDGKVIGAILDRNGLRPARYQLTKDLLVVCSEIGCVKVPDEDVIQNGKLRPGKIILVDLERGKVLFNDDIKHALAIAQPYDAWVKNRIFRVEEAVKARGQDLFTTDTGLSTEQTQTYQRVFGYTQEDMDMVLEPMFRDGAEPVGSMGDDTPLAVFSRRPRLLYTYFKQLFAQVTNPPIDPIREEYVTSLRMYLGKSGNIFESGEGHAHQMGILSPIVTKSVFDTLRGHPDFKATTIPAVFPLKDGPGVVQDALEDLCGAAENAIDGGACLIILSDRAIDAGHVPLPMLLAVSAVHQHLIRVGKRLKISLLVETAEAREVHHFACLISYGASVIHPYLALKLAADYGRDHPDTFTPEKAVKNYIKSCEKGLLKIMSKMGISTLASYHGAQIFEALGIKNAVVNYYFQGTPSRISGADLADIAADYMMWHQLGFTDTSRVLDIGGFYRFRRGGEYHAFNPDLVRYLHKAVIENDFEAYKSYIKVVNEREPMTIRDLLKIRKGKAIPLAQVEPLHDVYRRFNTPGISHGAISKETHETFAIAMNRIKAKSDSGEGGEDHARYELLPNGDSKNSAIKQVASARFGVTSYYLSKALELEIKIAQGAKPGEGGQLPGRKVSDEIARIRYSTPGVTLISPPPHHDIYSIEDLAQLIYDLKQSNPQAKVCVKLVSEAGVGTIAAGVVKAHADVILISGHDGGTGASPLSSIKHAGLPWELGISETQQVLVYNNLRSRVILRTDGGMKTGMDVVKAALMGAEEFGFGSVSMVAAGCVMVRQCHMNTCPVGVATQDPLLRKKYKGTPERVIHLFTFIAEEVRMILAEMGFRRLNDIIGRTDLLEQVEEVGHSKLKNIDLRKMLARSDFENHSPLHHTVNRNDWQDDHPLDERLIAEARDILDSGQGELHLSYEVNNVMRSVGTQLSYEIVSRCGEQGLPHGRIVLDLTGTVGQSFGAFAMRSLEINLAGQANDYVGKGLSGAVVTIRPPAAARFVPHDNIICGNTCLYGATSGKLFVNGQAGERFAVRNSGADAVVEGIGDHGCEYMTGGRVVILGEVGDNFAAGMTGGMAYVYDPLGTFRNRCNPSEVEVMTVDWASDEAAALKGLIEEHARRTGSPLANAVLSDFEVQRDKFLRVYPKELIARAAAGLKDTAVSEAVVPGAIPAKALGLSQKVAVP